MLLCGLVTFLLNKSIRTSLATNWALLQNVTYYLERWLSVDVIYGCLSSQNDPRYERTSETKTQIRFLSELDGLERKRQEDSERETLLRAAKVTVLSYCPSLPHDAVDSVDCAMARWVSP